MSIHRTHTQSFSHRGKQYVSVADRSTGQRFVRVDASEVLAYFLKQGHVIEPYAISLADLKALDLEMPLPLDPHAEYSEAEVAEFLKAMSAWRQANAATLTPPIAVAPPAVVEAIAVENEDAFDLAVGDAPKRGPRSPRKS